MDKKICIKCENEKPLSDFEFRKDKNSYRNICRECRNIQRRIHYQLNKEDINEKRRKFYQDNKIEYNTKRRSKNSVPMVRLRNRLIRSINKAFERKGFVREESYEEILGCSIEKEIENLLFTYKAHYKKDWDGITQVDIDHIIPIWTAKTKEQVKKLCSRGNLCLLTKEENHRKGGKMANGIGKNGKVKYTYFSVSNIFD